MDYTKASIRLHYCTLQYGKCAVVTLFANVPIASSVTSKLVLPEAKSKMPLKPNHVSDGKKMPYASQKIWIRLMRYGKSVDWPCLEREDGQWKKRSDGEWLWFLSAWMIAYRSTHYIYSVLSISSACIDIMNLYLLFCLLKKVCTTDYHLPGPLR